MNSIDKQILDYIKQFGFECNKNYHLPATSEDEIMYYFFNAIDKAYDYSKKKGGDWFVNFIANNDEISDIDTFSDEVMDVLFGDDGLSLEGRRNLIYVERAIDISSLYDLNGEIHDGVGECWTWKRGNGYSYDFAENGVSIATIMLCGYVHPKSVDWVETIYRNNYFLKDEAEIRMNNNAVIELHSIIINNNEYGLNPPYMIDCSAQGYRRHKYNHYNPESNDNIQTLLYKGVKLDDIFDNVEANNADGLIKVELDGKVNVLQPNSAYKYVTVGGDINNTSTWFDNIDILNKSLIQIKKDGKFNYLKLDNSGKYKQLLSNGLNFNEFMKINPNTYQQNNLDEAITKTIRQVLK